MPQIWKPDCQELSADELMDLVEAMTYAASPPLHSSSVSLLNDISKAILSSPEARAKPQYVALGYWLRMAAINRLCDTFRAELPTDRVVMVPRGTALHLPPTNVDTLFVYSWAVSVLAGNCNIVRMPTELDNNASWLVSLIAQCVADANASAQHIFCRYPYDGALNSRLSSLCDLRMVWGGDEKVRVASQTQIRPDGLSIGFPDRKSLALINSAAYAKASDTEQEAVAIGLFNDVFWFDQLGCGSPRILFWLGEPGKCLDDLVQRLVRLTTEKNVVMEAGVSISKFSRLNDLLADGIAQTGKRHNSALVDYMSVDPEASLHLSEGGGFLGHAVISEMSDLAHHITRKIQTITYFGLSGRELEQLAAAISGRGGYRIVPVGQALQFDIDWDGVALLNHTTRRIRVVV